MPEPTADLVRRSFGITVRSIDLERRCVDVVASTDSIDAHGDVIDQSTWNLKRYAANPVVLWNHNVCGYIDSPDPQYLLPIGYAENVGVKKGQLEATLFFVDEKASPMAELVWQGFVQKSLRAVSVGFKPLNVKSEMVEGRDVYRLSNCELFELSVCPMGSNPDAVAKAYAKSLEQLKDLASRGVTSTITEPPAQEIKKMTEEQIKALRDEHTKALAVESTKAADALALLGTTKAALATAEASVVKLTGDCAKAVEDKGLVEKSLAKANDQIVELEVDALVGKKIDPSEKPEMIELAKSNKSLFDKMISKRADMKLGEKLVPAEKGAPPAPSAASAGDQLADMIEAVPAA